MKNFIETPHIVPRVPEVFSRVRRGASSATGRHVFGRRQKTRAAKRGSLSKTWSKPETAHEKPLEPRVVILSELPLFSPYFSIKSVCQNTSALIFSSSKYCRYWKCFSFKNCVALLPWFFDGFVSSNMSSSRGSLFKTWPKPEIAHEKPLEPSVLIFVHQMKPVYA